MTNPLLASFITPYNTAPFSKIENSDFEPAFLKAIKNAKDEIDAIVENKEIPNYANTVEALEFSGQQLSRISSIVR